MADKLLIEYDLASKNLELYTYINKPMAILISWFRYDIIYKAGYDYETRKHLYDFILEEFKILAELHPHRLEKLYGSLRYQQNELLSFSTRMEKQFAGLAYEYKCSLSAIWDICNLQKYSYENQLLL